MPAGSARNRPWARSGLEPTGPPARCDTILSGLLRRLRKPDKAAVMLGRLAYRRAQA